MIRIIAGTAIASAQTPGSVKTASVSLPVRKDRGGAMAPACSGRNSISIPTTAAHAGTGVRSCVQWESACLGEYEGIPNPEYLTFYRLVFLGHSERDETDWTCPDY